MYTDFFKLKKNPFSLTPDASIFYENTTSKQCYQEIHDGVKSGHNLILVTGEYGSGKTLLAQKLETSLGADKKYHCIYMPFTSLPLNEILEYVCARLNLSFGLGRSEEALEVIEMFMTSGVSPIQSIVLMIDEAESLPVEVLNGLLTLIEVASNTDRNIQIVLFARDEPAMDLDCPELASFRKKISVRCSLESMSIDEITGYIEYRLMEAGTENNGIFTEEAVRKVYQHTKGTPRAINLLCDHLLVLAARNGHSCITGEQVEDVQRRLDAQDTDTLGTHSSHVSDAIASYANGSNDLSFDVFETDDAFEIESKYDPVITEPPKAEAEKMPDTFPVSWLNVNRNKDRDNGGKKPIADNVATMPTNRAKDPRTRVRDPIETLVKPVPTITRQSLKLDKINWPVAVGAVFLLIIISLFYIQLQHQTRIIQRLESKLSDLPANPVNVTTNEVINDPAAEGSADAVLAKTPDLNNLQDKKLREAAVTQPAIPENTAPRVVDETDTTAAADTASGNEQYTLSSTSEKIIQDDPVLNDVSVLLQPEPSQVNESGPSDSSNVQQIEDEFQNTIAVMFDKAERQVRQNQLTAPAGDNAIESYNYILKLEPDNTKAKQGLTKIKEDFILWADNKETSNPEKALKQYKKAQEIDPDDETLNSKVEEMEQRLSSKRNPEIITTLSEYARTGNTAGLKELLDRGVYTGGRDKSGNTPLMQAAERGHVEVVRILLEHGANVNLANNSGDTALMNAVWSNHEIIAKLLIKHDADINAVNEHGWNALMYAAIHGHKSMFMLLYDAGAPLDMQSKDGKTPLIAAAHNGKYNFIVLLLEKGVKVDAKDNTGWTPLMHAVWNNHSRVTKLLLKNGADSNSKNGAGWTPLMLAVRNGFDDIAAILLASGANKEEKNIEGNKAIDLAREQNHRKLIGLLE